MAPFSSCRRRRAADRCQKSRGVHSQALFLMKVTMILLIQWVSIDLSLAFQQRSSIKNGLARISPKTFQSDLAGEPVTSWAGQRLATLLQPPLSMTTTTTQLHMASEIHDKYQLKKFLPVKPSNVWETLALLVVNVNDATDTAPHVKDYVQTITVLRVAIPSLGIAALSGFLYPGAAMFVADNIIHDDAGVLAVVSQDASQYIQNILTTSGLVFSLLVGQTFYFMYQQQEAIYLALFEEVTMAKSLLEQVALVCQGRENLYKRILSCIERYVQDDLTKFNEADPAMLISSRPIDDPLEDILFLTSVGEPSIIYQTVRSLRQARSYRLGALQRKLPNLHMSLLWVLFAIVLFTFPLLGAGSQTIGGDEILTVQAWYLSFIVFGMSLTLRVIQELREPSRVGAYNAQMVLNVMVAGLEEDLELRLAGEQVLGVATAFNNEPSIDADGSLL